MQRLLGYICVFALCACADIQSESALLRGADVRPSSAFVGNLVLTVSTGEKLARHESHALIGKVPSTVPTPPAHSTWRGIGEKVPLPPSMENNAAVGPYAISPKGAWAFVTPSSNLSDQEQVVIALSESRTAIVHRLAETPHKIEGLAWSPDSNHLAVLWSIRHRGNGGFHPAPRKEYALTIVDRDAKVLQSVAVTDVFVGVAEIFWN